MKNLLSHFGLKPKPKQEGPRYGDVYERGLAAALDVTLIFFLLSWVFDRIAKGLYAGVDTSILQTIDPKAGVVTLFQQLWEAHLIQLWSMNFFIQVGLIGLFYVTFQIAYGTTPGRWLLGLKVVHHATHEPVKPWRYVLRYLAYMVSCMPLMLGVLWANFNKKRRTWHDYIAGTVVISTRGQGWYWNHFKRAVRYMMVRVRGQR